MLARSLAPVSPSLKFKSAHQLPFLLAMTTLLPGWTAVRANAAGTDQPINTLVAPSSGPTMLRRLVPIR